MNRTDELLLSRHLDGDLNPDELEYVDDLLRTDTSVLDHYEQLNQVRVTVAELPREPIPEDMVPRVRRLIDARKTVPLSRKTAEILGRWAVAAIVLVVSGVSLSVYWNHRPPNPKKSVETVEIQPVPAQNHNQPIGSPDLTGLVAAAGEHGNTPIVQHDSVAVQQDAAHEVAVAGDNPGIRLRSGNPPIAPKSIVQNKLELNIEPLPAAFQALLTATDRLDRRHSLRIHVATANTRVMDKMIGLLEKYRTPEVPLARFQEENGQGDPPSVDFLAFVPTNMIDDLNNELSGSFQGQIERDMPRVVDWRSIDPKKIKFVPQPEIAKAIAGRADGLVTDTNHEKTDALKLTIGPNRRIVGDAIQEPLEKLQTHLPSATVDQVIIQLRSDINPQ